MSKDEIEITPEMIEAGVIALSKFHSENGLDHEDAVSLIYKEMTLAKTAKE